jgi:hypothetical protein
MIYEPENITAIVEGRKGQSRRVYKLGETAWSKLDNCVVTAQGRLETHWETIHYVLDTSGRVKWRVGNTYAVQPGRGQAGVWWHPDDSGGNSAWIAPHDYVFVNDHSWRPLRIRLLSIRRERVQDIGSTDVMAEGITYDGNGYHVPGFPNDLFSYYKSAYEALWDRINKKPGTRWTDNPWCWVLSFEVVK